ncbi:MAG: aspartate-semialdehyde dehydrogenase [Patescibacteria group bacterium]
MSEKLVGFVGYRGMVGSVLMDRMQQESDFAGIDPVFLSTSQAGAVGPVIEGQETVLADAYDLDQLQRLDTIVTCQGSDYTQRVHDSLRQGGWNGYWIDAASELRMQDSSILLLDPINRSQIDQALDSGIKDLIGANCTVSTMLMGLGGLFKNDVVEWAQPDTYQAVSGAGAVYVKELLQQMQTLGQATTEMLDDPAASLADIDKKASQTLTSSDFPINNFGYPIAGNILPWIDSEVTAGQSREEWKAEVETNKLLGLSALQAIAVDGTCVRVGSLRSHAQAVTIKLKQDIPLEQIEQMISSAHEWVKFVPNNREATLSQLTPVAVSGTLDIAVGRVRKLSLGPEYLTAFVVGDQLLWGAAEPLRRALKIIVERG